MTTDDKLPAARFSQEWRDEHAARGDQILAMADGILGKGPGGMNHLELSAVGALADLAAAHYAAANVRARPS